MPEKKTYSWQIILIPLGILLSVLLPLPRAVLDFGVCINFAFSLLTVCWVFSLRSSSSAQCFPSMLLYLCLLRLGLNLASTRWIVASGTASPLIFALGSFFSLGNILSSILACFMLFFVNFLVIARGAERVAEVRSRFVLDALPGRQMSLDADLLSGRIFHSEVELRKQRLIEESDFFSSMEGVFRFVKGDAIISCVLFLLNTFAAVYLSYALSCDVQTLWLTVLGDALVSQVPALFTSCAAATLIGKIGNKDTLLAQFLEYYHQARPHFRLVALGIFSLLAIESVPKLPILLLGGALWIGYKEHEISSEESFLKEGMDYVEVYFPESLSIGELRDNYIQARKVLMQELGVPFPLEFRGCSHKTAFLKLFGQSFELTEASFEEMLLILRRAAYLGVHGDLVRHYIEDTQRLFGFAIEEVIPRKLSCVSLVALIRLLVKERISLKLFPQILEAIAIQHSDGEHLDALAEKIRKYLGKQIGRSLWREEETLKVITIDVHVEKMISNLYSKSKPIMQDKVIDQVRTILKQSSHNEFRAIVTGCETRFEVKKILDPHFPDLLVLSQSELPEELPIICLGIVSDEVLLP